MEGMTRKRKWMVGTLVLGVGALVLDRTLLGPPETASASESASVGADTDPADAAVETPAAAVAGEGGAQAQAPADLSDFAQRLAALPQHRGEAFARSDAFALPQAWVPVAPVAPSQAEEQAPELSVEAQMFLANHVHNGTIITEGSRSEDGEEEVFIAVIDGKRFFVGMELDGFRLVRVVSGRSLWRAIEGDEQLILKEPGNP